MNATAVLASPALAAREVGWYPGVDGAQLHLLPTLPLQPIMPKGPPTEFQEEGLQHISPPLL